ncbi:2-succinyl-6-hydroxy-2,4-cyclohexadiene-1-carboxylate synthase [Sporosarcina trichiuri]|uniref:2-succinyl-6-hydroxy-2, 4-cyclohexadiene-1-carboxylate synthase n=1 Tax=Sporosarcina trichiuri TaxID=3056445 RepID=UPI0025B44ACF|nr:2-succinyl-6-hydroxy-2,4-cyclohexadiene-1-carboxylate synthase [Sporosarcina sp. 0.2-SM1T-5]WJY27817.1 2-succinyl-6-hydroxy-2,4-cyclohexadiene-1-carboxylate synthase [Sporosarcina sp. 0.2-SM1T-5]
MASEYLSVGGESLHYETYGCSDRPAVVLLHGFTGSTVTWHSIAGLLADRFHVVLVDLWGHGRSASPADSTRYSMASQTEDLDQLFTYLGLDRILLVGYSMGGRTALGYAAAFPERIAGLLLESASPGLRTVEERADRRRHDAALAARLRNEPLAEFVRFWEAIALFDSQKWLPEQTQSAIRSERMNQKADGLAGSLEGIGTGSQPSYWRALPHMMFPVLLVTGTLDGKFTRLAQEMETLLPNAVHEQVPDAGHAIHVEKPKKFATIIENFAAHHSF